MTAGSASAAGMSWSPWAGERMERTDGIHVWRVPLSGPPPPALPDPALLDLLSPEERTRALRFRFPADRARFVRAHAALRTVLGRALDRAPAALRFEVGRHGKPRLSGPARALAFNLSHSGDWALVAARWGGPVGVDVERREAARADAAVVRRFFAPSERTHLLALRADAFVEAFFRTWVRKEAWIKAVGTGLSVPPDRVAVPVDPAEPARLLAIPDPREDPARWWVRDLLPLPGHSAALAAEIPEAPVRCLTFRFDVVPDRVYS